MRTQAVTFVAVDCFSRCAAPSDAQPPTKAVVRNPAELDGAFKA